MLKNKPTFNLPRNILFYLFAILLSACGGGGEEGTLPSNSSPAPSVNTNPTPASVTVSYTNPGDYVWGTLATGQTVYIDRNYTYTNIPSEYEGFEVLETANDDKSSAGSSFISFEIDTAATVFVAHVADGTTAPAWLADWNETGLVIGTTDRNLYVYSKEFPAGTVVLGGNEGAPSMYTVIIAASGGGGTGNTGGTGGTGGTGTGTVNLTWTPPMTNADGSTLTDLAGYKIYYSTTEGAYTDPIIVNNPGLSSYVVEGLTPNTYYFVVTTYDYSGNESPYSNVASKQIQ